MKEGLLVNYVKIEYIRGVCGTRADEEETELAVLQPVRAPLENRREAVELLWWHVAQHVVVKHLNCSALERAPVAHILPDLSHLDACEQNILVN